MTMGGTLSSKSMKSSFHEGEILIIIIISDYNTSYNARKFIGIFLLFFVVVVIERERDFSSQGS